MATRLLPRSTVGWLLHSRPGRPGTFVRMNMCTETEPLMKSWDVDELPTFVFLKGCRPAHKNLGVLAYEFDPHVLETTVRALDPTSVSTKLTEDIAIILHNL